ncbi:MAG TPA: CaiB/BaiF CoA-transferase family protein [Burkholderiaceae bacterium]|nr:CaiB/BaiF CoA-transferase family protein [Burkholderiaceae bacterium]
MTNPTNPSPSTASTPSGRTGPLHGVRILDLSRVLAAPWCVQNLADMGADVIKIERPGPGDESRHWGPPWLNGPDGKPTRESAYFMSTNRNKRSAAIDLANPEGQALIRKLAEQADICIENFKVGDLARYGLDYASLSKVNPRLIYCSVTGFGQDGPWAARPGYDYLFQGMGGLMSVTGERDDLPGGGPQRFGVPIVDLFTGMYATISILAALNHRNATGEGQHIDISLMGAVMAMSSGQLSNYMVGGKVPGRTGNASPNITPYGVYPCSDGLFIVASANQGQFSSLCKALGHPEWIDDPRFKDNGARMAHQSELHTLFSQILSTKPRSHWEELFLSVGVPSGPINNYEQAMAHPQVQHLKTRISIPHPTGVEAPGIANPMRFSKTPVSYRRPPPMLGQHTQEVLREMGLDDAAIDTLVKSGAVKFG